MPSAVTSSQKTMYHLEKVCFLLICDYLVLDDSRYFLSFVLVYGMGEATESISQLAC